MFLQRRHLLSAYYSFGNLSLRATFFSAFIGSFFIAPVAGRKEGEGEVAPFLPLSIFGITIFGTTGAESGTGLAALAASPFSAARGFCLAWTSRTESLALTSVRPPSEAPSSYVSYTQSIDTLISVSDSQKMITLACESKEQQYGRHVRTHSTNRSIEYAAASAHHGCYL